MLDSRLSLATSPLRNSKAILDSFTRIYTTKPHLNRSNFRNKTRNRTRSNAHLEIRPLIKRFNTRKLMNINPEYNRTRVRTSERRLRKGNRTKMGPTMGKRWYLQRYRCPGRAQRDNHGLWGGSPSHHRGALFPGYSLMSSSSSAYETLINRNDSRFFA